MSENFGFGIWDITGKPSNTGVVIMQCIGVIELEDRQTGTWQFNNTYGFRINYMYISAPDPYQDYRDTSDERIVRIDGNKIIVTNGGGGNLSSARARIMVYLE